MLKQELLAIESAIHHKSASQMSRMERSIASSHIPAFLKDSTQPLGVFIAQSLSLLTEWIETESQQCSNIEVMVLQSTRWVGAYRWQIALGIVKELRDYVRDIWESTRSFTFDEGAFQSYLAIGGSLITRTLQCSDTHKLGSKIKELLDLFRSSWDLTTGTSMENIWNSFRPPTAGDSRELDLILRVERLADRFDSIVWRSTGQLDTVISLRRSILGINPLELSANPLDEDALKASLPTRHLMASVNFK